MGCESTPSSLSVPANYRGLQVRRFVSFVVAVALWVSVSGCGIALRAPTDPDDPYVQPRDVPALPPVNLDPLVPNADQTVVSLTFDDGWASQARAAEYMAEHRLPGTFFVNSGTIGRPHYLSLVDLDVMAASGHEIGGHTLTHPHLERLAGDEMRRQLCNDRVTLLDWGFAVRSFAYPFGVSSKASLDAARYCGYNSARGLSALASIPGHHCDDCARTENLPPVESMLTRAPDQVEADWTVDDLRQLVTDAGPGWLQLTFHGLCDTECSQIQLRDAAFQEFITWLADRRDSGDIFVSTVGDVVGGPVQPPVPGPVQPPAAPGANGVPNPGLEEVVDGTLRCWIEGGYGANTAEFTLVSDAHSGKAASRLVLRDHVDGDAKLLQATDLGECAPAVRPGQAYTVEAWYKSTAPTQFSVQYRLSRGVWVYGVSSEYFPAADEFTRARWALPPIPEDVTAISFGLALSENGELVTDDFSLVHDRRGSP